MNEQINLGYELPPELRQAANAGFGGGGFGQARQQDLYGQAGFQTPGAPGPIVANGGLPPQSQGRNQIIGRATGPLGNALIGQTAGRMAGGVGDSQQAPVSVSLDKLPPIPRAARTINDNLVLEQRYPDLDTVMSRE